MDLNRCLFIQDATSVTKAYILSLVTVVFRWQCIVHSLSCPSLQKKKKNQDQQLVLSSLSFFLSCDSKREENWPRWEFCEGVTSTIVSATRGVKLKLWKTSGDFFQLLFWYWTHNPQSIKFTFVNTLLSLGEMLFSSSPPQILTVCAWMSWISWRSEIDLLQSKLALMTSVNCSLWLIDLKLWPFSRTEWKFTQLLVIEVNNQTS